MRKSVGVCVKPRRHGGRGVELDVVAGGACPPALSGPATVRSVSGGTPLARETILSVLRGDRFRETAFCRREDHTIGVVLTGEFDDGTSGLQAIKRAGGTTVVQDPAEALVRSMPDSALRHAQIDHCVPLSSMPALLLSMAGPDMAVPHTPYSALIKSPQPRAPHDGAPHPGSPSRPST